MSWTLPPSSQVLGHCCFERNTHNDNGRAGVYDTNIARGILTNADVKMEENLDTSTEPPLSKAIQASIELSQGAMGLDLDKSVLLDLKSIATMSCQIVNQRMNPLYLTTGMLGIISQFFNPQAQSEEHRRQTECMMGGIGADGVPGGVIPDMQYSSEFWRVSVSALYFSFHFIHACCRFGVRFSLHTTFHPKFMKKAPLWSGQTVCKIRTAVKFSMGMVFCGLQPH